MKVWQLSFGRRVATGEDMAEFHCHGGVLVASRVLRRFASWGSAEPGEFTRRAFLNGKMDLTQAEAVMDVIRASKPKALRAAQEQLAGRLGRRLRDSISAGGDRRSSGSVHRFSRRRH